MRFSRIVILVNPISGKGRGWRISEQVQCALLEEGFQVELKKLGDLEDSNILQQFVEQADLLLLAGGDGTLMHLLPVLTSTHTPVYMLPTGNESLFAKEFSMSVNPEKLLLAIQSANLSEHFVPEINGRAFFTMASVGLDSEIICRIAERRLGTIRHASYVAPTLLSALKHSPARLKVHIDGVCVIDKQPGFIIVANNKQYALGVGFAPEASSRQELLTVRFFPYKSFCGFLLWYAKCFFRDASHWSSSLVFNAARVEVEADKDYPVQADGEHVGCTPFAAAATEKTIKVLEGAA